MNWDLPADSVAKKLIVTEVEEAKGRLLEIHREYMKYQIRMTRMRQERDR